MSPVLLRTCHSTAHASADEFASQAGNPDFVLSLARGLRVIESFEGHHDGRSIVEISQSTGLSRASIRRILLTLELLGYVERTRQVYRLKTQVLRLGFSYLSSSSVVEAARPVLERITEQLHESSSMSMLDGGQIVYVARSAASRVLAAGLSVGSRLPAYCTSMGRVLLAALPDEELARIPARSQAPGLYAQNPHPHPANQESNFTGEKGRLCHRRRGARSRLALHCRPGFHARQSGGRGHQCRNSHIARRSRHTHASCLPALQEGARTLRSILI